MGIFTYTPEPHVASCPIFGHPLFPVFDPHIQKVMPAFGQTAFGQNRIWPKNPTLAKSFS